MIFKRSSLLYNRCFPTIFCCVFTWLLAQADTVSLAGSGYTVPATTLTAAPGQILTVSVYGLTPRNTDPGFSAYNSNGMYATLNSGLSASPIQPNDGQEIPVGIFAVQQTKCSIDAKCAPLTTLTIRLPFELQLPRDATGLATLKLFDQGVVVGEFAVHPVSDNVHFANTCDQTLMLVSVLSANPVKRCTALVQHLNGKLVTSDDPARPGDVLMAWMYGLGTTVPLPPPQPIILSLGPPLTEFVPPLPASQTFDLGFVVQPNVGPSRPLPSTGLTHPLWAGINGGVGLYQVNIALPSTLPDGPFVQCNGVEITSNVTITVAGVNSIDGAQICVVH